MNEQIIENEPSVVTSPNPLVEAFDPGPLARETGLPGVKLDFNCGVRMLLPEGGKYRVRISDQDAGLVLFDSEVKPGFVGTKKKYYIRYLVELWKDGRKVLTHHMDPAGKKVRVCFPTGGVLGDVMAWFPYVEEFRKKHGCEMYCTISQIHADVFRPAYPDIHYVTTKDPIPDIYATYYLGAFTDSEYAPMDHRLSGLAQCAGLLLGLGAREIRPVLTPCARRPIPEPYVCIATQASGQRKYWNNPRGWDVTVDYLKSRGYRVLCIDRDRIRPEGGFENAMPAGAEDFTGDRPLQERIDLLGHADFFIGLSSGLSWLAWGSGTPVVMISGFTLPMTEFYTPYRVIQYQTCNGCWNDSRLEVNSLTRLYCPRHEGTERAYECSRYITPELVCRTIDRLMADYGLPGRKTEL